MTERPEPVIWLTLDAADDDPVRLWTHLATGVQRLGPGLASTALSQLGVPGAPVEHAVDEVMNSLVAFERPVTIVLDDLHTVKSESSLGSIAHGIERLPANARVVATTRSDPSIGLARLRARRALAEFRARDLAFTVEETRELMSGEGVELSTESVALLTERTEGWPAGLYLAALWLRELDDPDRRVREFAGSARQVGDYLSAEVLTALDRETREFVLRTSVLGRFTPALCDAVLGREDSSGVLAELNRSNMFLVALDARGEWYRYHHLFGEVLQLELGPEPAVELRRRARPGAATTDSSRTRSNTRPRPQTPRWSPTCWPSITWNSSGADASSSTSGGSAGSRPRHSCNSRSSPSPGPKRRYWPGARSSRPSGCSRSPIALA